jgi:tetratricopeptide (TPR) repeat protein
MGPRRPPEGRRGWGGRMTADRSEREWARAGDGRTPLGWVSVAVLVAGGLVLCAATSLAVSGLPRGAPRARSPDGEAVAIARGVEAYQRDEWEVAEGAFREVLAGAPGHARAQDYLERLALIRRDAERLRRAEEALVAGEPERASLLASAVAPNSPLFAQSERVARGAREQLAKAVPPRAEPRNEAAPSLDVTVALGEALALYEAGNFGDAVERATALAEQAQPDVRAELTRWAQDARRFSQRFLALPAAGAALVRKAEEVMEAIVLDERLSDGHYARELRERMASAFADEASKVLDRGDVVTGCAHVHAATEFVTRGEQLEALGRRCENEAFRRIAQARDLERASPEQALALYREVLDIAVKDSASYRAAETAIGELEWSGRK